MWTFEPHVAEQVFEDFVKELGLTVEAMVRAARAWFPIVWLPAATTLRCALKPKTFSCNS